MRLHGAILRDPSSVGSSIVMAISEAWLQVIPILPEHEGWMLRATIYLPTNGLLAIPDIPQHVPPLSA